MLNQDALFIALQLPLPLLAQQARASKAPSAVTFLSVPCVLPPVPCVLPLRGQCNRRQKYFPCSALCVHGANKYANVFAVFDSVFRKQRHGARCQDVIWIRVHRQWWRFLGLDARGIRFIKYAVQVWCTSDQRAFRRYKTSAYFSAVVVCNRHPDANMAMRRSDAETREVRRKQEIVDVMFRVELHDFRYDGKWRIIDNYTICWIVEFFKVAARPKWTDYRPPPQSISLIAQSFTTS